MTKAPRRAGLVAGVCGAVALTQVGPAATWLPAVRMRWFPWLAGIGDPAHVALTFDDGPHPRATPRLLDLLAAYDVRATFFQLGAQVAKYPEVTAAVTAAGHEVAVHGWDHTAPLRPWRDRGDMRRAVTAVGAVAGRAPVWYRPPYGVLTMGRLTAARAFGLRPVLWTAWAHDWRRQASARSIAAEVARSAHPGGTILLHDSDVAAAPGCWAAMLDAVPTVLDRYRRMGVAVGTLDEHFRGGAFSRSRGDLAER